MSCHGELKGSIGIVLMRQHWDCSDEATLELFWWRHMQEVRQPQLPSPGGLGDMDTGVQKAGQDSFTVPLLRARGWARLGLKQSKHISLKGYTLGRSCYSTSLPGSSTPWGHPASPNPAHFQTGLSGVLGCNKYNAHLKTASFPFLLLSLLVTKTTLISHKLGLFHCL